ncbi:MAG: ankyrin repeat domain-containing protein, partial [Verrucomicrobiales bacterium]
MKDAPPTSSSATSSDESFWSAVAANDIGTAREFLEKDASLATRDFRPEKVRRDAPYENRFPLLKACQEGHCEMAEILLEFGADIDCKSPTDEQRGLGWPVLTAVERGHFELAHLLLDHGADIRAHGYCSASMVEEVYELARGAGAPIEMVRKGFECYLGEVDLPPVAADAPEAVRLFDRVLRLGGRPSMDSIIYAGNYALVEE